MAAKHDGPNGSMGGERLASILSAFIVALLYFFFLYDWELTYASYEEKWWYSGLFEYSRYIENWGLDILFEQRGHVSAPEEIVVVLVDVNSFKRLGLPLIYPWPRRLYAEVLHILKSANAEAVIFDIAFGERSLDPLEDKKLADALGILPTFIPGGLLKVFENHHMDIAPLEEFSKRVAGVGSIGTIADSLHKIRHLPVGEVSLAARAAQMLRKVPVVTQDDPQFFDKYINYYGSSSPFKHVSIADVLEHKVSPDFFKDKIVFIGPDLIFENANGKTEGKDVWVAPDGKDITGVMIEATAFGNFIHQEYLSRIFDYSEVFVLMLGLFLITLILLATPPHYAVLIAVLTFVVTGSIAYILFLHLVFFPVVIFNIVIWFVAIARSVKLYVWEQKRKALLAQQFGCYLDPVIVKEIVASGEAPDLGGRMIGCALMFTDIVGFTTYSESRSPIDVGDSLNQYFTRLQRQILSRKGTFLSMLGDGLFALWGAPIAVTGECDQALLSARGIHDGELITSNLRTRIGLHYGEVLVGHFGSRERYDYSAIGDQVNLTSRIEGLNKLFGTYLLMSEDFVVRLSQKDSVLYLGKVRVAGISKPVAVYTLDTNGIGPDWEAGVRHFEKGDFQLALEMFDSVNRSHPFSTNLTSPYREAISKGIGEQYLVAHTK